MINIDKHLFLPNTQNITAICSGASGSGKTWLAVTLAHALNIQRRSILLFDADSGLSNIHSQLGWTTQPVFNQTVEERLTFNQAVIPINKRKFDVWATGAGSELWQDMPIGRLQIYKDYLQTIAQNYDHVVVDLSSHEKIMTHLMPLSTQLILICTIEPANLVATYHFLQHKKLLSRYKNLQIVVNYANSYEEGLRTYNTLRRACEQYIEKTPTLLGVVRNDTHVREAIYHHALLLQRYPNCDAAQDISQIAGRLLKGDL